MYIDGSDAAILRYLSHGSFFNILVFGYENPVKWYFQQVLAINSGNKLSNVRMVLL